MKKITKKTTILIGLSIYFILLFPNIMVPSISTSSISESNSGTIRLEPDILPSYLRKTRTRTFIESTRSIPENNATSLEQIFFKIGSLRLLDPSLSNLSTNEKNYLKDQVVLFQNTDNGFGGWYYDESSVLATNQAIHILNWLGNNQLNKTNVKLFLDTLENHLTGGFASNRYDSDSDIYTTSTAVETYKLLGFNPINKSLVINALKNAQNINQSISVEEGGFGLQTNYQKGIYWNSSGITTRAALIALSDLNSQAVNQSLALNFLKGLQTTLGGFTDIPYNYGSITGPYTSSVLEGIYHLNGTPNDESAAISYLLSLENPDGGFKLKSTSTHSSNRGTYYALNALKLIGANPSNIINTINFILQSTTNGDGFGGTPGEEPTLRETFDAVSALRLMDKSIQNTESIISYIASYRNPDGGYGLVESNMDSTSRAVITYDLLGIPLPNPDQTRNFVKSLQQTNGGFSKKLSDPKTYVISTYRALRILELLENTPVSNLEAANYLLSNQNSDGGFGGYIGDTSDVTSTYRAVRGLSILKNDNYDSVAVKNFVLASQVMDGGFKRSPSNVVLPKNVSNLIHTYSASQIMKLLNFQPNNVSALYNFVLSTRNTDGGFAEHPRFTSNIAYTFTALWILKNFHYFSSFSILIPENLNFTKNIDTQLYLDIQGELGPLNYTVTKLTDNSILLEGINQLESVHNIDISSYQVGTYSIHIEAVDQTQAKIDSIITLNIVDPSTITSQGSPTPSLTIITSLFSLLCLSVIISRKKMIK